ncbi:MAG: glycoside hydrolase family 3 N-terminal domain-containing protein [Anaerolineales bacterium]
MASFTTRIDGILSQMTLDEKLAQLGSFWFYELQTNGELDPNKISGKLTNGIGQITRIAGASTLDPTSAAISANRIQTYLVNETRLGIPAILHEECCSGAMVLGGTMYPQIIGLAATFQPELAKDMTSSIREQLLAIGARQALAPVLDLGRDPRWGRVEETFGEDPTLASQFGVAYIKGLQTDDLAQGVMATGKHFVGHSASLGGLNCGPVQLGMHEIYDVYLAPFQAAIRDANLASIMNAYPELDGELVAASRRILTELLREKLGFDGLVVSDYEAIIMIHNYHNVSSDKSGAAVLALQAGIDVELPTVECYGDALYAALEKGDVSLEYVETAVRRHLRKKFELGLFENPFVSEGDVIDIFETENNRSLAREIAQKSIVLMKNDGTLPLKTDLKTLAVIGPNADNRRNQLGDYSYTAIVELMMLKPMDHTLENAPSFKTDEEDFTKHDIQITTVLEGIKTAASGNIKILHAEGCEILGDDTSGFDEAVKIAQQADVVVLVLGDKSGLTPECSSGETRDSAYIHLPGVQEELAKAVVATGKPVVVVLVNGRPFAMPWLSDNVNAILEAWLPGEEGGRAVADILFGKVNPGGKLPLTFPRSVGQVPINYNHKPSGMRSNWYVDYIDEEVTPLYPFGHGLSYTTFDYSELRISPAQVTSGERVDISLKITNTGSVTGDEVVQLYICDEFASMPRPVKELKGFVRLTLDPGETKLVTFDLLIDQVAFYDAELNLILEPGRIVAMLGSSSRDIRMESSFEITGSAKMPVDQRIFHCPVEIG